MEIPGYKIQQSIAEGGMATAYLAVQESLRRPVVLKVLHKEDHNRPEDTERFLREGRLVASLNHPNVITIYDIGVTEDVMYMSMEYVDGGDLRARMRTSMTPAEALHIITAVAHGLSAAHKRGIVHRDVKPGNILFRRDGTPLLTDFGIAKELTVDHDLTHTGVFLGSPNYMAPEQAEPGAIDGRADIYSLGIIFYEMLTGQKPFRSESVIDIIVKHKQAPIPTLPAELSRYQPLINLMLAKQRKDRFRDVDSLLHFVRQIARTAPARETDAPAERKRPFITAKDIGDKAQSVRLPLSSPGRRRRLMLSALLAVSVIAFQALDYLESQYHLPPQGAADASSAPRLAEPANLQQPLPTGTSPGLRPLSDASTQEVIKALIWLGQHSLDENRLTSPVKDNAYHYFSRLLAIEPDNAVAKRGIRAIAERFAFLAEKELADGRYETAQRYVALGMQIDPQNQALIALKTLSKPKRKTVMERLYELFRTA